MQDEFITMRMTCSHANILQLSTISKQLSSEHELTKFETGRNEM